ncbi:hypothetical protein [Methylorubrum aminovorans]
MKQSIARELNGMADTCDVVTKRPHIAWPKSKEIGGAAHLVL